MISIKLPIKTVSESNKGGEHWTTKHRRHKMQKNAVILSLKPHIANNPNLLPCLITLTRIAPRMLDSHDNLCSAFKWILDAICELLIPGKQIGHADSDERINIWYEQERGDVKEYAIRIQISSIN